VKRITIVCGHYGSGKSEVSVNLAIIKKVETLIDLDIVNPYFRSREASEFLAQHHIKTVSSPLGQMKGNDLPFIAREAFFPFFDSESTAIYDCGGDGVGAVLLNQFEDYVDESFVDVYFCVNVFREKTATPEQIIDMVRTIENWGRIKVTGFINNTNLLRDTTIEDLLQGERVICEVQKQLPLPIVYTAVYEKLLDEAKSTAFQGEILPIHLYLREKWM